jgi:hypothetical protein
MLRTREEIALLLKKAKGNLQKTQEIHRQLESLMRYIDDILRRKNPPSERSSRSNTYKES